MNGICWSQKSLLYIYVTADDKETLKDRQVTLSKSYLVKLFFNLLQDLVVAANTDSDSLRKEGDQHLFQNQG